MSTLLNDAMNVQDEGVTRVRAAIDDDFALEPVTIDFVPSAAIEPVDAGPLPPPPRKYHRPSAYWADRWLTVSRP
jgi:hypothetical protein